MKEEETAGILTVWNETRNIGLHLIELKSHSWLEESLIPWKSGHFIAIAH